MPAWVVRETVGQVGRGGLELACVRACSVFAASFSRSVGNISLMIWIKPQFASIYQTIPMLIPMPCVVATADLWFE